MRLVENGLHVYALEKVDDLSPVKRMADWFKNAFETNRVMNNKVDMILTVMSSTSIEVTYLETEKQRRSGHGSAMIDLLCGAADQFNVTLILQAKAASFIRRSLKQDELEAFYRRRGFIPTNGNTDQLWMQRQPGAPMTRRRPLD